MRRSLVLPTLALGAFTLPSIALEQSQGARAIEVARNGGVVIACRHAITDPTYENEMTLRFDDPTMQRRLSARGERQAEAIGSAFRVLRIPIGEVIASPMDRARRTAELMAGRADLDSLWFTRGNNYGGPALQQRRDVLGEPVAQGNRLIVSHVGTLNSVLPALRPQLEEGDCVVVRPADGGRYAVVEVVPWRAWLRAAHLDDPPQS
jgi:broad specificity phosphatase PhoE